MLEGGVAPSAKDVLRCHAAEEDDRVLVGDVICDGCGAAAAGAFASCRDCPTFDLCSHCATGEPAAQHMAKEHATQVAHPGLSSSGAGGGASGSAAAARLLQDRMEAAVRDMFTVAFAAAHSTVANPT